MESWQIVVLVVMCVVFIVIASLLCYLIWRYGNWSCLQSKMKFLHSPRASTDTGTSSYPNECRLYYYNLELQLQCIDLNQNPARSFSELRGWICNQCGYSDPRLLTGMAWSDSNTQPLDMEQFLCADTMLPERLRRTAQAPLCLLTSSSSQASEYRPPVATDISLALARQSGGVAATTSAAGTRRHVDTATAWASSVPPPLIFPIHGNITADTPVYIAAPVYRIQRWGQNPQVMDEVTTMQLETAFHEALSHGSSREVVIDQGPFCGCTFFVDAARQVVEYLPLQGPTMGVALSDVSITRSVSDLILRYSIDNLHENQWAVHRTQEPIYLQRGVWCLRAKSSREDDAQSSTTSRVFVVR